MDMNLTGASGERYTIPEADWENLVHLLERIGIDLVKLVSEKTLGAEDAKHAGEALGTMRLETVETVHGHRIRPVDGQDTDPVMAMVARLAEQVGDDESAAKAREMLLAEAATLVVRPLSDQESGKIAEWSRFLIESGGVSFSS